MVRSSWIVGIFLVLSVALQMWIHERNRPSRAAAVIEDGAVAPAVSAVDLEGVPVDLASLRGRYVVLDFWASWCAPCRAEFAALEAWWKGERETGLLDDMVVLAVNVGEPNELVRRFQDKRALPFRIVLDESQAIAQAYRVRSLPTLVLIDKDGNVEWTQVGYHPGVVNRIQRSLKTGLTATAAEEKS